MTVWSHSRRHSWLAKESWVDDLAEPDLRRGLVLYFRAHCWLAGIEQSAAFCREGFVEFDAVLATQGIQAARAWVREKADDLMDQRANAGLPAFFSSREDVDRFWRKLHRNRKCWPPNLRELGIICYRPDVRP